MILAALGLAVASGVAGYLTWDRDQTCRALIEADLRRYRATDITIERDWLDFDRDTATFDVRYRDRVGDVHSNRCKVAVRSAIDAEVVYWASPVDPRAA